MTNKYNIFVSSIAIEQIKKQLNARNTPKSFIRLGLKANGCSGYTYVFMFEDNGQRYTDSIFEFDGITIVVDKKSIVHLNGATLDYVNTLNYSGFKFNNPNKSTTCGCGKSFSVKGI